MPARTIYLMRHGDCRSDDIRRYIGWTDHPLNRTGRAQAVFWQRELRPVPLRRIVSSDLLRSRETARIIAGGHGVPVEAHVNLREIDMGEWDGLPMDDIRRSFPEEFGERGADLAGHRPPGGESFDDLARRVLPLFEELVESSTGSLLIVGHAGVNRVILCHLLGKPRGELFLLQQEYGCLNLIDATETGCSPRFINAAPPSSDGR